jgi:photosystem II stability/assembly factor-like uncharacterized protein
MSAIISSSRLAARSGPALLVVALLAVTGLTAGCGTVSSGHQAAGPASSSSTSPTSSLAGSPAAATRAALTPAPAASSSPAAPSCAGPASAGVYNAPGISVAVPKLAAVQFVSARQGWVVGAGRVLATSDGGRAWTTQYAGPAGLYQLDFIDAWHGWAVGTNALLRTANGGATWTPLGEPCGSIRSVHFVTPSLGYAVAGGSQVWISGGAPAATGGGALLTTTNGGRSWTRVAGAPAQAQTACFSSLASGFVGTPGKVWHTTDGGKNWSLAFTEPAAAAGVHAPAPDITVLECAGGNAAWVLFLGYGAALGHAPYLAYASQDARNWRVLFEEPYIESGARPQVHAPAGPGSYPGPFSAISPDAAAFVGFSPPVGYGVAPLELVTASGASLSKAGNVGGISQAYGAAFISTSQGWVVGKNLQTGDYAIEATADGGRTWTRQYLTP